LPIALLALSVILLFLVPRLWPMLGGQHIASTIYVTGPDSKVVSLEEALRSRWIELDSSKANSKNNLAFAVKNLTGEKMNVVVHDKASLGKTEAVEILPGQTAPVVAAHFDTVVSTDAKIMMPIIVSIVLLFGGLFVILAKRYAASDRHWAYATVGTIVGYWLKG
jgi:hypothetical protein